MDLKDVQWAVVEFLVPKPVRRPDGRGRRWRDRREVLNGVLWVHNFRRLVTRYERHLENWLGMIHLGCIRILLRTGRVYETTSSHATAGAIDTKTSSAETRRNRQRLISADNVHPLLYARASFTTL